MPPPGIPNHNLATPAQRLAYRKVQAELQARDLSPSPKPKPEIVPTIVVSDWSIDAQGCLTRTIGGNE